MPLIRAFSVREKTGIFFVAAFQVLSTRGPRRASFKLHTLRPCDWMGWNSLNLLSEHSSLHNCIDLKSDLASVAVKSSVLG